MLNIPKIGDYLKILTNDEVKEKFILQENCILN